MTDAKTAVPISHDASPTSPTNITDQSQGVTMEAIPLWKRVWRHSLTQMMLLSVQAFCGPAMSDAITGLGGGGLATPQVSNISTAIRYATLAVVCFLGGPIVNKIGVKWALVIGSMSFPIQGSAYYCNSKFGNQWYLILSGAIGGIGTACWYVAEAGAIMTLAPSGARGKYLALWIVSRNLGQLVGGAINLSKNHEKGANGGVTPDTFIAFVIIECIALPFALLITPFERVIRSDGTQIVTAETLSTKQELKRIVKTITSRLIVLSSLWALWSFFYTGTWTTYLGTYFSVRARALSSLISPFFCIIGCFGLGYILDMKGLSQRRRAQIGLYTVVVLNVGVYIWSIIMQTKFNRHDPGHIDWDDGLYASSFLPYFFVQTTGPLSQSYMYWLLSSFATDAQENVRNGAAFRCIEAIGQAIAYGMNTQTTSNPLIGFCVTFALLGASLLPMIMLVNTTPDRIPADVIAEQQDVAREKLESA
ncbi:major facilitator superfamily domain-containing protein [Aspergillus pseudonomiae]|uniref:Major facilitator superfamily domain-containing protein n=1 Tax=Aspergillus pseudonomiae TaxID=1506151 RepID=A0A5N7DEX3_9EURO|nr:major facilitator superfamily domain-containing protein [Aspergillus pseudonomiae]KAB8256127.1 major facilitator superfamily domain-containing protein [Aspergillus pseudonomiae]KAE8404927.1 major facilitator superfamily domain-containing protein [Aspergillus pseudonomiae]